MQEKDEGGEMIGEETWVIYYIYIYIYIYILLLQHSIYKDMAATSMCGLYVPIVFGAS